MTQIERSQTGKESKKFQAIQTHYDGYHFRSRLEARWAVFFNALDIEYHYEPEGYVLNGEPYLPDFWLPGQKCFIEIKGKPPTCAEMQKAQLLCLYTQKAVCMAYGNINYPNASHSHCTYLLFPGALIENHVDSRSEKQSYKKREISGEVSYLIEQFYKADFMPFVQENTLSFVQEVICQTVKFLPNFITMARKKHAILSEIAPLIALHEQELKEAFTITTPNITLSIEPMVEIDEGDCEWVECTACHQILLNINGCDHDTCSESPNGEMKNDTPRLIAAYTAAREARFQR